MSPAPKRRPKKKPATKQHSSGLTIRNADLSRARPFKWAWEQRVLLGYLNLQIGEEGIGKGNLTAWQAARISRGDLPGDLHGTPSRVAFLGDEDAWDHIWVPRLEAAGADLGLVEYIEGAIDVQKQADALRDYISDEGIALVYFDQLLDNLGFADSWKDKDVRDALNPVRRIAQETDVALLASMHPNKRQGTFRERISGTAAFNALSRSSMILAPHPQEEGRAVVVRAKGNYSVEPAAFEFRIEEAVLDVRGRVIKTSRIHDTRETNLRWADLQETPDRKRADSEVGQARALLAEMFSDRKPRPAKETLERFEAEGFKERTVQGARRDLGIETWQQGYPGVWHWGFEKPKPSRRIGGKPQ